MQPLSRLTKKLQKRKIPGICNRVWGVFLSLMILVQSPFTVRADDRPLPDALYAGAAVLMDAGSGRVLYGKNADRKLPMASTTKIMTCILVLELADPEASFGVSAYAQSMPKVKLNVKKGEQYTVNDLLYSLMLESHNDSAVVLAEGVGKQFLGKEAAEKPTEQFTREESKQAVAAFAKRMNDKALELGCKDTLFITPNGLDASEEVILEDGTKVQTGHGTTAKELARIMAYCIGESCMKEEFLKITRTPSYSFYANGRSFCCVNHNSFLQMMDGAQSGKTGFTNQAGYCYVGSLQRDGKTLIVALLACGWPNHKSWKWSDTRKLMQYGLDRYEFHSFSEDTKAFPDSVLQPVPVLHARSNRLGEQVFLRLRIATEDTAGLEKGAEGLLMSEADEVHVEYRVKQVLDAPVREGTVVGSISFLVDDVVYRQEKIVTAEGAEAIDPGWCVRQIVKRFLFLSEAV